MNLISTDNKSIYNVELEKLAVLLKNSKYVVVFTGAGLSTASGLTDYRGKDGVWTRKHKGLSEKPTVPFVKVKPTNAHKAIQNLVKDGIIKFVITQNIDNLHRRSGIPESQLAEIHGNYNIMRCKRCDRRYELKELSIDNKEQSISKPITLPSKKLEGSCGGLIIPTFVNFGTPTLKKELDMSYENAQKSDIFLSIGTTMSVEPASLIPNKAIHKGAKLIIINIGSTSFDNKAYKIFKGDINTIIPDLYNKIKKLK
jgi:mono-ADP-ribosyltransferase sirtuin 6